MNQKLHVIILLILVLMTFSVSAACAGDRDDAVKLVKDAVAYYKANGLEKALDTLNDPKGPFIKGNLYVFAYDTTGTMLANVVKQTLLGQNVLDVPDARGKKFRREIVERAKKDGSGWVDYFSEHPKTRLPEEKTTYFERADDVILACGIFK